MDILDAAIAVSGAAFGNIQLLDPESGDLKIVAQRGFPQWWIDFWGRVSKGKGACGTALERGQRVIVEDVERSPIFAGTRALKMQLKAGVRAVQSTPLVSRAGKRLGMFSTHYKKPGRPDERAVRLLDLIARQASDVIERDQAEEALRRRTEELTSLLDALPAYVWFGDADCKVITGNRAANAVTGVAPGSNVSQPVVADGKAHYLRQLKPDGAEYRVEELPMQQAIATRRPVTDAMIDFRFPDGRRVRTLGNAVPLFDAGGAVRGSVAVFLDITKRMEAEEALLRSEALYRAIGESIDYGVWVCAPDGRNTYASESFLRMVGITQEQCSNFGWGNVLHPEDAQRTIAAWKRCVRTGGKWDIEHRFRGVDGQWHHVLARGVPVKNARGEVICWAGINLDINRLKRVEAALAAQREELQLILDSSPALIFYKDRENRFLRVNHAVAQSMGRPREELEGRSLFEFYPRAQAEAYWQDDQEVITSGQPKVNIVEPMQTATGERWVRTDKVACRDASGKITGIIGFAVDITEQKRAEARLQQLNATLEQRVMERTTELRDAHDRLRAMMDSALVGILTLDERGVVQTVNPAVASIFGFSPDELVDRSINRLLASPVQAAGEEFLACYTRPGDQRLMGGGREVLGRRKGGEVFPVELTVSDFQHGGQRQFVAMVRDTSERQRLERELLEVGERERRRLGYDLHDGLGQHLHALYYLATLLQDKMRGGPPEQSREMGRLARQLERGLELTRSLARGLQPVNALPEGLMVALRELAERTREVYGVGCEFLCRKTALVHRHSAANHLYRIAQEAVNNAIRHGKPKRVQIRLTVTPRRIILSVRDDGAGVWRPAKRRAGMGLRVMQYRADAVGGSLVVRRHPRGGTEVVCSVSRQALLEPAEKPL